MAPHRRRYRCLYCAARFEAVVDLVKHEEDCEMRLTMERHWHYLTMRARRQERQGRR